VLTITAVMLAIVGAVFGLYALVVLLLSALAAVIRLRDRRGI
jgi:hypothetical protein